MALVGLREYCIIFSTVSNVTLGPAEQLQPMTSTGHSIHLQGEGPRIGAVAQVAVVVDGDLGDDDQVPAGDLARSQDGFAQFIEIAEGLQDEQIDAGFEKGLHLLGEDGARLREGGRAERLDVSAERAEGAATNASLPAASRAMRTPA